MYHIHIISTDTGVEISLIWSNNYILILTHSINLVVNVLIELINLKVAIVFLSVSFFVRQFFEYFNMILKTLVNHFISKRFSKTLSQTDHHFCIF